MTAFASHRVTAGDGLGLNVRDYGVADGRPAVLCLPGLARTAADFHPLACALRDDDPRRRIVSLDYRGRGGSDWDPDPARYDIPTESADILAVLAALGIERAVVIGTSRGGLHAMVLGTVRPDLLAGVVLNDIGPVLEPAGLARIQGYVGRLPVQASWAAAEAALRQVAGSQYTALSDADWAHYTRTTYGEGADGRLAALYDPGLAHNLAMLDPAALPALWEPFTALAGVPLLVIRGDNSDLLSAETVAAMAARHPDCTVVAVPGQGHAPLLTDAPTIAAIARFVSRCGA